jgi:hypothetical protein
MIRALAIMGMVIDIQAERRSYIDQSGDINSDIED